jgi:hypothetical protein
MDEEQEQREEDYGFFVNPVFIMFFGVVLLGALLIGIAQGTWDTIKGEKTEKV